MKNSVAKTSKVAPLRSVDQLSKEELYLRIQELEKKENESFKTSRAVQVALNPLVRKGLEMTIFLLVDNNPTKNWNSKTIANFLLQESYSKDYSPCFVNQCKMVLVKLEKLGYIALTVKGQAALSHKYSAKK